MNILKKTYKGAFSTYCLAAVTLPLAAKLGVYVRDRIVREDDTNKKQ